MTQARPVAVAVALMLGAVVTPCPPARGQQGCVGDCSTNRVVTVDELVKGVNIALGTLTLSECPVFDSSGNGRVTVDELVTAVNNALTGCPPAPPAQLRAMRVGRAPTGIDDSLWDDLAVLELDLSNMSSGLVYGDGQLNMSGTFAGATDFNQGQPADLKLRAAHDGTKIYILAEWHDTTFNLDHRRWLFNGPTDPLKPAESASGWTSQRNDDRIALAFEIESASSEFGTFASAGCAASCHNVPQQGGLDMRPEAGKVDLWQWQTARSDPLGFVNDQVSSAAPGRLDDAGVSVHHRNQPAGGDNRSGPASEWDGTTQQLLRWDGQMVMLDPAYVLLDGHRMPFEGDAVGGEAVYADNCALCHGASGEGGFGPALTSVEFARLSRVDLDGRITAGSHPGSGNYAGLTAEQRTDLIARVRGFSGVPGYYLMAPEGSAADVVSLSNADYTLVDDVVRVEYRVLMIRALDTGNDDDAQFTPGEQYVFGVALMDNDGRNHIGSRKQTLVLDPEPANAEHFATSLHRLRTGKETFYSAENGGFETLTKVDYASLACRGCHATNFADGTAVNPATYSPNCGDCHANLAQPQEGITDALCLGCHSRQGAERDALTDVHRDMGFTCMDCHSTEEMHGNGTEYASLLERPGPQCEDCHTAGGRAGPIPNNVAHSIHTTKVDCSACHVQSVVTCYSCHFESEVAGAGKRFFTPPRTGFKFLLNFRGKVRPATFQSLVYQGQSFYTLAPYYAHSVTNQVECSDCHANAAVTQYKSEGKITVTQYADGQLQGPTGVIPVPPDWQSALVFDFLDYTGGPTTPIPETDPDLWQLLKTGADLSQLLYGDPLTAEQLNKLSLDVGR